jgi:hypothetical protein
MTRHAKLEIGWSVLTLIQEGRKLRLYEPICD